MAPLYYSECQILVNGVPAPEYDDDDAGPERYGAVTKYIEAISGAEFSVKIAVRPGWEWCNDLGWRIYLDGRKSDNRVVRKEKVLPGQTSWTCEGESSGQGTDWVLRKFRFADIVTGKRRHESCLTFILTMKGTFLLK
jgi:hypothetical protein